MLISDRIDLPAARARVVRLADAVRDDGVALAAAGRTPRRAACSRSMLALRNVAALRGSCSLLDAVAACTLRPARLLGVERERGTLRPGARADLVALDRGAVVRATWIGGRQVYRRRADQRERARSRSRQPADRQLARQRASGSRRPARAELRRAAPRDWRRSAGGSAPRPCEITTPATRSSRARRGLEREPRVVDGAERARAPRPAAEARSSRARSAMLSPRRDRHEQAAGAFDDEAVVTRRAAARRRAASRVEIDARAPRPRRRRRAPPAARSAAGRRRSSGSPPPAASRSASASSGPARPDAGLDRLHRADVDAARAQPAQRARRPTSVLPTPVSVPVTKTPRAELTPLARGASLRTRRCDLFGDGVGERVDLGVAVGRHRRDAQPRRALGHRRMADALRVEAALEQALARRAIVRAFSPITTGTICVVLGRGRDAARGEPRAQARRVRAGAARAATARAARAPSAARAAATCGGASAQLKMKRARVVHEQLAQRAAARPRTRRSEPSALPSVPTQHVDALAHAAVLRRCRARSRRACPVPCASSSSTIAPCGCASATSLGERRDVAVHAVDAVEREQHAAVRARDLAQRRFERVEIAVREHAHRGAREPAAVDDRGVRERVGDDHVARRRRARGSGRRSPCSRVAKRARRRPRGTSRAPPRAASCRRGCR